MTERRRLVMVFHSEASLKRWLEIRRPLVSWEGEPTPYAAAIVEGADEAREFFAEDEL